MQCVGRYRCCRGTAHALSAAAGNFTRCERSLVLIETTKTRMLDVCCHWEDKKSNRTVFYRFREAHDGMLADLRVVIM